uniref:Cytosolic fatty-acid binding proteins domain-containing protein n=1 Tax=Oncorhynchus tshawytscha TaxID=74940 RepID=A0AAZ3SXE7_ONCTS
MPNFAGTWKMKSSENFDELLKALGVNAMLRKVAGAAASKPHVEIRQDGEQFYIKTSTTVRTTEINFHIGQEFDEETVDGRKCKNTYTTRCHRKAIKIIKDNNHPSHCLFTPLSSRRRGQYRCNQSRDRETEKQLLSQGHQTVKQPPLTLSGCCQHTDSTPATLIMEIDGNWCKNISLATLNNATSYNVYIPYTTHLICIYCTLYHLLHLAIFM